VALAAAAMLMSACEMNSKSRRTPEPDPAPADGGDKKDNPEPSKAPKGDANVVVAMGDSVTAGSMLSGPAYPQLLSEMTGKHVINAGVGGVRSEYGVEIVGTVLARHKPGHVLIMYGINDIIAYSGSYGTIIGNLRKIVRAAKEGGAIPVLATIPPRWRPAYGVFDHRHTELNRRIRSLASDERAKLADVERAFGKNRELLLDDGFHPNDDGNRIIAVVFREAL